MFGRVLEYSPSYVLAPKKGKAGGSKHVAADASCGWKGFGPIRVAADHSRRFRSDLVRFRSDLGSIGVA